MWHILSKTMRLYLYSSEHDLHHRSPAHRKIQFTIHYYSRSHFAADVCGVVNDRARPYVSDTTVAAAVTSSGHKARVFAL